ncbi:dual specificity phosphatase [Fusarium albosuccineum]|uniref:protein-tyrosine-phosphatase n=1 Tax=Fusarium albosuccineum TaxID=1237068 RepID=A0A8H4LIB8_9HYPO|nr:dual specificity phosphatase [Fusarium albosuccineum]
MDDMDPPSISQIAPNLFVGNVASSMNRNVLRHHNITAIVSLLDGGYAKWSSPKNRQIVPQECHLFVPCLDNSTMDILTLLDDICDFIDLQLGPGSPLPSPSSFLSEELDFDSTPSTPSEDPGRQPNVLIHCRLGMSRSASVAIAYLMRQRRESLNIILPEVRTRRRVKPRDNFLDQLQVWEAVGYDVWQDKARRVPKEAYQGYLDRRAVRLAAKGLTGNEPILPVCV